MLYFVRFSIRPASRRRQDGRAVAKSFLPLRASRLYGSCESNRPPSGECGRRWRGLRRATRASDGAFGEGRSGRVDPAPPAWHIPSRAGISRP